MYMKMTTSIAVLLLAMVTVGHAKQMFFHNKMNEPVWVGSQGNSGKPPIDGGGWEMKPGEQRVVNVADDWAGRFWGRTKCDGNGICQTGNCGGIKCNGRGGAPPATLAEFTFGGFQGKDFYDISLVDGFNIKVSIEPTVPAQGGYHCAPARCTADVNQNCPSELRKTDNNGPTIGCKSACEAFNTDQYCCRGAHDRPETCKSSDWPKDYPKFFKEQCPDAYSYAYDDHKSTFTCENTAYRIIFG